MRSRFALPLAAFVLAAACAPDAPLAPTEPTTTAAAPASRTLDQNSLRALLQPFRDELTDASAGLLYTSESDYPFDYVSRPLFLRDTLTMATFRLAFGVARTTPVEIRTLDRFFARHIENVEPYDATAVALIPRYQELKYTIAELLNAPKAYCVGTIQIRCYVVGTSPNGVIAGLATTSIET